MIVWGQKGQYLLARLDNAYIPFKFIKRNSIPRNTSCQFPRFCKQLRAFSYSLQGDEAHLLALLHKARKLFLLCSLSLLCRYCQVSVWLPRPLWLWLMASLPLKGRMDKADSSAVSVSVQRLGGC